MQFSSEAFAIWKLSTSDSYRAMTNDFGIGKETVGVVVIEITMVHRWVDKITNILDIQ